MNSAKRGAIFLNTTGILGRVYTEVKFKSVLSKIRTIFIQVLRTHGPCTIKLKFDGNSVKSVR